MYFLVIHGWYCFLTWLPTYLVEERGFAFTRGGWFSALPLLAIAAGVAGGGWCSDWAVRRWRERLGRQLPAFLGFPCAAGCVVAGYVHPHPIAATLLLSTAAGAAALVVVPAWTVYSWLGGQHAGTVTGAMNMFGNLGGARNSLLVGWSRDACSSWSLVFCSMAAAYAAAMWLWVRIRAPEPLR